MKRKFNADIVVVGSGPGGATIARDLAVKGKKVIILERGKDNRPTGKLLSAFKYQGGLEFFGNGMKITKDFLQVVRCITTGGTSMMYLGCAWDPPEEMFDKHGISISKEVSEIKDELDVQPIPDYLLGPRAKAITESAVNLGYEWQKIPKFLKPENCKTNCNSCYYGCPNKAKWQARDWILDAVSNNAELITETACHGAIIEGGRATGVRAIDKNGNGYEIKADAVVVAAGGIGSPAILQKSGIYDAGGAFFFDPFVCAFGYLDEALTPSREFPMVTGMHAKEEGVMITDMPLPFGVFANYAVMGFKPHKLLKRKGKIGLLIKIKDNMGGLISVNEKISAKPLTVDDQFKLNMGKAIAHEILQNMGAKDIWYSGDAAAHPGGTCRIGHIVDKNLETKFKNLYVADASVIPEPWGLPPTLTIMALARRLSKHMSSTI